MKKLFLSTLVLTSLVLNSCIEDDDTPIIIEEKTIVNNSGGNTETPTSEVIQISGLIETNTTWTPDNVYVLNQKVVVKSGNTLTIQPGTIIKGKPGTGSLASALIVERGAQINASGTASQPIIFTAESDNIQPGQTAGTNLTQNDRGLWGGLIILGNAPGSFDGATEAQIEGIPADESFGKYGGTNEADNSGVIQYVSIRHGGALIGEGNEINGLTLGSVGNGTVVENIEVVANVDDGVEFFGGTVNATNILVWAQGDDAIDIDQAYKGTIDNLVVVQGDESDHAFEVDGPEGTLKGAFTIQNATLIGNSNTGNGEYADYRDAATGTTKNVFAYGFPKGKDVELDNNETSIEFQNGSLIFEAWELVDADNTIFVEKVGCKSNCDDNDKSNDIKESLILNPSFSEQAARWTKTVTKGSETVGANTSALSWTYANTKGSLGF